MYRSTDVQIHRYQGMIRKHTHTHTHTHEIYHLPSEWCACACVHAHRHVDAPFMTKMYTLSNASQDHHGRHHQQHKCHKKHRCSHQCAAPGCHLPCAAFLEDDHLSTDVLHCCGPAGAESGCPKKCELCDRQCASTDHFHAQDPLALHICGEAHECRGECVPCANGDAHGKRGPQFKSVPCAIPLPPGFLIHRGLHTCSHTHVDNTPFAGRCRGMCKHLADDGSPDCTYRCCYATTYDSDGEEKEHTCECQQHAKCGMACQKNGAGGIVCAATGCQLKPWHMADHRVHHTCLPKATEFYRACDCMTQHDASLAGYPASPLTQLQARRSRGSGAGTEGGGNSNAQSQGEGAGEGASMETLRETAGTCAEEQV